MTNADKVYTETCKKIMNDGIIDELDITSHGVHWEDGTPAKTKRIVHVVNRYKIGEGDEFPILTIRHVPLKNAIKEILWIWQKNSNNVDDLGLHIWDSWIDENHTIGKAYGYQLGKMRIYNIKNTSTVMNQVEKMFYDIKNQPISRRIVCTMWEPSELHEMRLEPCAHTLQLTVVGNTLNGMLIQRSQDMIAAGNWNPCQYSFLIMLIAKCCGLQAGELMHCIADCHIYDRHLPIAEKMLEQTGKNPAIIGKDVLFTESFEEKVKNMEPYEAFLSFDLETDLAYQYEYEDFPYSFSVAI